MVHFYGPQAISMITFHGVETLCAVFIVPNKLNQPGNIVN